MKKAGMSFFGLLLILGLCCVGCTDDPCSVYTVLGTVCTEEGVRECSATKDIIECVADEDACLHWDTVQVCLDCDASTGAPRCVVHEGSGE
jgi:hypothetical protein